MYLLRYPRIVKMQCTKCMVHVYVECMTQRWTRVRPGGGQKFHIFKIFRNSFRTGTCVAQMSTQQCFLSLFFSIIAILRAVQCIEAPFGCSSVYKRPWGARLDAFLEKLRPDRKIFSGPGLVNTRTNRVLMSLCISGCRFAFPRLEKQ